MIENLTVAAKDALELARQGAEARGHARVEPLHLLHALVLEPRCGVERIFRTLGVRRQELRREVEAVLASTPFAARDAIRDDSTELTAVLEIAAQEARRANFDRVDTDHLLLGLLVIGQGKTADLLRGAGLTFERVKPLMKDAFDVRKLLAETVKKVSLADLEHKGFRKVKRRAPGTLACPNGHGPMDQVVRQGVRLAVCGECMSTFFAPGQLEELLKKLPEPTPEGLRRFLEPDEPT